MFRGFNQAKVSTQDEKAQSRPTVNVSNEIKAPSRDVCKGVRSIVIGTKGTKNGKA